MGIERRRLVAALLLSCIVGYGALLRLSAITEIYGPVSQPRWLQSLQERTVTTLRFVRPNAVRWEAVPTYPHRDGPPTKYRSDPYTYLQFARQMPSFSAAHYREPLFPYVTRWFLRLMHDQDVAVSFASACFSVLAMLATYLLGRELWSRWVGLGAALLLAIDYDVISVDVEGFRDDAFMCSVVLCTFAMVRYRRAPTPAAAVFCGLCAGIACLLRLTALSFLAPACLYLLVTTDRTHVLRRLGLALACMTAMVAPYLINCWRVYGDPLYAVNYHTGNYVAMERQRPREMLEGPADFQPPLLASEEAVPPPATVRAYIGGKAAARPYDTLDTFVLGLTSYPFNNKWGGFDRWLPGLGVGLSWAALAGLILYCGSWGGRLALIVVATSLIPFAITWKMAADWRFTEHVYPFFLIAAAGAVDRSLRQLKWLSPRSWSARPRPPARTVIGWGSVFAAIAVTLWFIGWKLPMLTVAELLAADQEATIMAGPRDGGFFSGGWSAPSVEGNVTVRASRTANLRLPLPKVEDYFVTLRAEPLRRVADQPPTPLVVRVNGQLVSELQLRHVGDRMPSYSLKIPANLVKAGTNVMSLTTSGTDPSSGFRVWYARLRPSTMKIVGNPAMALDSPTTGTTIVLGERLDVTGWAIDRGPATGTGVTSIEVYAYPAASGTPPGVLLGHATMGLSRPDIGTLFGARFDSAGFALRDVRLGAGAFHVVAYARSAVTGTFNQALFSDVTVTSPPPSPAMALDSPTPGVCRQPCLIAGWAVDRGDPIGTGVESVIVTATPVGDGPPVILGNASYGSARPDVGGAFGRRFANSGYTLLAKGLTPGRTYDLRVEARSSVTGTINQSKVVRITAK